VASEVTMSPQADQLAWVLHFEHPYKDRKPTKAFPVTAELWISKLDGSHMHMVYYQHACTNQYLRSLDPLLARVDVNPQILRPQWSPDGRQISFVLCDRETDLCTIPAD